MGLPSPAAAGLLASYVLFSRWDGWYGKGPIVKKVMSLYGENMNYIESVGIPVLTVLVALVMVSTIRYPSLKKWKKETVKPWTLVMIIVIAVLDHQRGGINLRGGFNHLPPVGFDSGGYPKGSGPT